jgi:hypothetical protein
MRTTVDLDEETGSELTHVISVTREKQAVVLRQAIRLGLPLVANRLQTPRPEGFFKDAYRPNRERQRLERAMLIVPQKPER